MAIASRAEPRVVHLVDKYLPYSQTWIHRQIGWSISNGTSLVAGWPSAPGLTVFPVADAIVLSRAFPIRYWPLALLSRRRAMGLGLAASFIRDRQPDVLHAHFGDTGWRWCETARRLGIPLVTSFYGRDLSVLPRQWPWWNGRYRELFARAARILCEGPAMARALVALGCDPDRIGIQRLGIDVTRVDAVPRRLRPGEPLRVLAAARFIEKKGLPDAIVAVGRAARDIDVCLTIAGGTAGARASRGEAGRIARAAAESGLGHRLRFVGVVPHDQLLALAREAHVFLQPSKTASNGDTEGGAPVTLIDLAATGLPAVATRHADIPEVVLDHVSGLLAGEGDVGNLAAHLITLARQPGLLERLGEGAAAHIRSGFSVDHCAGTLHEHYRRAASLSQS